jgi:hypothetical protein
MKSQNQKEKKNVLSIFKQLCGTLHLSSSTITMLFIRIKSENGTLLSLESGHTPPTNVPLSSMEYLTLRNQIVDHNADLWVLWRGA